MFSVLLTAISITLALCVPGLAKCTISCIVKGNRIGFPKIVRIVVRVDIYALVATLTR